MLVVLGFATIRTITPLMDPKNHSIGSWLVMVTTVIAYSILLSHFLIIK